MRKMRFKILQALCMFAFVLLASMALTKEASADVGDTFTEGGVEYEEIVDGVSVSVISCPAAAGANVVIPETLSNGLTVTEFYNSASYNNDVIRTVSLPATITMIDSHAFSECDNLSAVTFSSGSNLVTVGNYAFSGCKILTSISFSNSVTSIGEHAFSGCEKLSSVTLPTVGLSSIKQGTFYSCKALTSISIPACVGAIEANAFYGAGFKTFTIPNTIIDVGEGAFSQCLLLESVTLSTNALNTKLADDLFYNCSKLKTILLPSNITEIGESCFSRSGLTNILISDKVTTIGKYAFYNCDSLKSIQFKSVSVPSIPADCSLFQDISNPFTIVIPVGTTALYKKNFDDNGADVTVGSLYYESNIDITTFPSLSGTIIKSMEGNKIYYGEPLSKVKISASFLDQNGVAVAGTLSWVTPNVILKPGTQSVIWTFVPTSVNALTITGTESVYIEDRIIYVSPAVNQSKTKGTADPVFQFTCTPLLNGDILNLVLGRVAGENAGSYAYTIYSNGVTYADSKDSDCYDFVLVADAPKFTIISPGITSIKLNASKVTLGVGEKFSIKTTLAPTNHGDSLIFSTSKKAVATVSSKGVITAKKTGTARIKVKSKISNKTKTITVKVLKAPGVKNMKTNISKKTLTKGSRFTVKVTIAKGYASKKITFTSSKKSVATVSSKGVIVAKKKGKTTIYVKTYNGKKKAIKITVK